MLYIIYYYINLIRIHTYIYIYKISSWLKIWKWEMARCRFRAKPERTMQRCTVTWDMTETGIQGSHILIKLKDLPLGIALCFLRLLLYRLGKHRPWQTGGACWEGAPFRPCLGCPPQGHCVWRVGLCAALQGAPFTVDSPTLPRRSWTCPTRLWGSHQLCIPQGGYLNTFLIALFFF